MSRKYFRTINYMNCIGMDAKRNCDEGCCLLLRVTQMDKFYEDYMANLVFPKYDVNFTQYDKPF